MWLNKCKIKIHSALVYRGYVNVKFELIYSTPILNKGILMKLFSIVSVLLVSSLAFAAKPVDSVKAMQKLAQQEGDYIGGDGVHGEYSLANADFKITGEAAKYLAKKEKEMKDVLIVAVSEGNIDHSNDLDLLDQNPAEFLGVKYLFEIENRMEVYKDGVLVGYVLECNNNVDAAIIQDGSWETIYLDLDMNVVAALAGQS